MWLFTTQGFYSVVEHRENSAYLIVRTRLRADLEALSTQIPGITPFHIYDADYPWRAVVSRTQWQKALVQLAAGIGYDNFKRAIAGRFGGVRSDVYDRVWREMLALQEADEGVGAGGEGGIPA